MFWYRFVCSYLFYCRLSKARVTGYLESLDKMDKMKYHFFLKNSCSANLISVVTKFKLFAKTFQVQLFFEYLYASPSWNELLVRWKVLLMRKVIHSCSLKTRKTMRGPPPFVSADFFLNQRQQNLTSSSHLGFSFPDFMPRITSNAFKYEVEVPYFREE